MNSDPPYRSEASQARRRAAVTLAAIALAAVIVALLMITLTRGSRDAKKTAPPGVSTPANPASPPTTKASGSPRSSPSAPASHASTQPVTTSCRPTPCVLTGDPGNVVAAINAFRASQARPVVTGAATAAAGSCAVHSGDAPYCSGSYYWTPVTKLQGTEVVSKIAGYGDGRSWLLDPHLTRVGVGCAQADPAQYECAVVDTSPQH